MIDPVEALREIAFWRERARGDHRRIQAYRRAADAVERLDPASRAALDGVAAWQGVPGIGPTTAAVIVEASAGRVPEALATARAGAVPIPEADDAAGRVLLARLRGDLHSHTDASDGTVPLAEMAAAARRLGREYLAITDHSPRLRVANGLSAERLLAQLDRIAELNEVLAGDGGTPLRVLSGIEVDILGDGSLDQSEELLAALDVVVGSVHSELRMPEAEMTERMVTAVSNPHLDVLGHCTGRLVEGSRGTRPPSELDAEAVFIAARESGTAVEINSRPEREDPPDGLIDLALALGCLFAIDSDAHAPGHLDFLGLGASRAAARGVPAERIVTTWPLERLLAWTTASPGTAPPAA